MFTPNYLQINFMRSFRINSNEKDSTIILINEGKIKETKSNVEVETSK